MGVERDTHDNVGRGGVLCVAPVAVLGGLELHVRGWGGEGGRW